MGREGLEQRGQPRDLQGSLGKTQRRRAAETRRGLWEAACPHPRAGRTAEGRGGPQGLVAGGDKQRLPHWCGPGQARVGPPGGKRPGLVGGTSVRGLPWPGAPRLPLLTLLPHHPGPAGVLFLGENPRPPGPVAAPPSQGAWTPQSMHNAGFTWGDWRPLGSGAPPPRPSR